MTAAWVLAAALVLVPGEVITMDAMEADPDQASLDNAALCFFDAVGFLQRVPATPSEYAPLLAEAREILAGMGIRLGQGEFSLLVFSEDGSALLTPSGLPIACAIVGEEHDDTEEGSAAFVTYEFTVPGDSVLRATAVIELEM